MVRRLPAVAPDILSHAYRLVRADKGSARIDGVTFSDICN